MTQQPEEGAVGGTEPVGASDDNLEAILAEHFTDEEQDEQPVESEAEEATEETDELNEDDPELEAEPLPPIEPPVSLTAEEKEAFKNLPREAQEFTARRIGELEKGFQTKAQEAAQAQVAARNEALQHIAQVQAQAAEQLERYAQQFTVQPPSAELYRVNPEAYAQQFEAFQIYSAQRESAQREAEQARAVQAQYEAAIEQQEREAFVESVSKELPEYFDPQRGPELQQKLSAIALELGFPKELLSQARHHDVLAMHKAAEWKAKADQLDRLNAKKMERVRAAKGLPKVATPGAPRPGTSQTRARSASEQALKGGTDRDLQAYLASII